MAYFAHGQSQARCGVLVHESELGGRLTGRVSPQRPTWPRASRDQRVSATHRMQLHQRRPLGHADAPVGPPTDGPGWLERGLAVPNGNKRRGKKNKIGARAQAITDWHIDCLAGAIDEFKGAQASTKERACTFRIERAGCNEKERAKCGESSGCECRCAYLI